MVDERRFYEALASGARRSAPAAQRNRSPIADVLGDWLPSSGLVLEIASGTGEHAIYFAERFPDLVWQPSDVHPDALSSIAGWSEFAALPNLRPAIELDAATSHWPLERADAVISINMVHISAWRSSLGLVEGAQRLLGRGAPLILYGPWMSANTPTAPSNLEFDADLKRRDPHWGLRHVEEFEQMALAHDFVLEGTRTMPANNLMLLFRRS